MEKRIYMDHAATTYIKPEVLRAMMPYLTDRFGNAGGVYSYAREAKAAIDHARDQIAKTLNAAFEEIYFTAGGSESDNLLICGAVAGSPMAEKHIITTKIEHHAVLHTCEALERAGVRVTYLDVDREGFVTPEQVEDAICPDTVLCTVMTANNEVGTIQPICEIAAACHRHGVLFHTDAVQAFGSIPLDVQKMGIDLLSLSGHKLYGPKGIGAMYIKKGIKVLPVLYGGGQERGHRPGTENVPGIVGLGAASELAYAHLDENAEKITALRDRLIQGILAAIPGTRLNGPRENRLPNNASFCFEGVDAQMLLMMLDTKDVAASSGSACTAGVLDPSHVLLAMGVPENMAKGSLRLTLGTDTTEEEITEVLEILPPIIQNLREHRRI